MSIFVAVTVKVPSHSGIIRAALSAGKHVLSEWPLGVDLAEADELKELAHAAGVVHAIGLQGLHSPDAGFVADLIAEGRLGALRAASLVASGGLGGARVSEELVWAADPAAGVSNLSVIAGHALATLAKTLGTPLVELVAVIANLDPEPIVVETGERITSGIPDQVALLGTLSGGAVVTVAVQGGNPPAASGFSLRIIGVDGTLTITPRPAGGEIHIANWEIELAPVTGDTQKLSVPGRYRTIPDGVPRERRRTSPPCTARWRQRSSNGVPLCRASTQRSSTTVCWRRLKGPAQLALACMSARHRRPPADRGVWLPDAELRHRHLTQRILPIPTVSRICYRCEQIPHELRVLMNLNRRTKNRCLMQPDLYAGDTTRQELLTSKSLEACTFGVWCVRCKIRHVVDAQVRRNQLVFDLCRPNFICRLL